MVIKKECKKGQISMMLLILVGGVIILAIFLFVAGVAVIRINTALNQDVDLGQVNLATLNSQTFGKVYITYLNQADWWGLATIFGMVAGLFLSSYVLRGKMPKYGIIFDIGIILAFLILSVYISNTYNTLVGALTNAGETFLEDYTPKTSFFISNLPIFTTVIGVTMSLLFHSSIPRRRREPIFQGL